MTKKFLVTMGAAVAAVLLPMAAMGQAASTASSSTAKTASEDYKYEAYVGVAYTSLNQVNQSRYGLWGGQASVTRYLSNHVGLMGEGAYYKYAMQSGNPGDPSVSTVLFGPTFHVPVVDKWEGFVNLLVGAEHSGGEQQTPKVSFAGGFGGGLDYQIRKRWTLRAQGERIGSSFSLPNNVNGANYSPHTHWNARASFGVVYAF